MINSVTIKIECDGQHCVNEDKLYFLAMPTPEEINKRLAELEWSDSDTWLCQDCSKEEQ